MNPSSANSFNTNLSIFLIIAGVIGFFALLFSLYLVPESALSKIDYASIKAVLLFLGSLILATLGVLIYWAFHAPSVRRMAVNGWRAVLVYSAAAGGFSIFGWPRLASFSLDEAGLRAGFSPAAASLEVWPNLALCFAGIAIMTVLYMIVGVLENKYGWEL